jgi:hypothetical protein
MNLGETAKIIVLIVLTIVIFAFALTAFHELHKTEQIMVDRGERDEEIIANKDKEGKKSYKIANIVSTVFSYVLVGVGVFFMVFSIIIKFNGQRYLPTNTMVIASDSMSEVARDDQRAENGGYLTEAMIDQEFARGDIITLSELPSQEAMLPKKDASGAYITVKNGEYSTLDSDYLNHIFVYYNSNTKQNIVHRLVQISPVNNPDGTVDVYYHFRGDAWTDDGVDVAYSALQAEYDGGKKVKNLGYFVLFFSDTFGEYAVITSLVMVTISSVYSGWIQKDYDQRWEKMDHSRVVVYDDIATPRENVALEAATPKKKEEETKPSAPEETKPLEPKPEETKPAPEAKPASETKPIPPEEKPVASPAPKAAPKADDKPTAEPHQDEGKPAAPTKKKGLFVGIVKSEDDPNLK